MDRDEARDSLNKPLLLATRESSIDESEFHDARNSSSIHNGGSSIYFDTKSNLTNSMITTSAATEGAAALAASPTAPPSSSAAASSASAQTSSTSTPTAAASTTGAGSANPRSYHGSVSLLSTGTLFPSTRGIVDTLPHPTKPCLLYADHDPLAAVSHICLLEKEVASSVELGCGGKLPPHPKLYLQFSVVHVCQPLANRGDAGARLLKKLKKGAQLTLPLLLNGGEIFQDGIGSTSDGQTTNPTYWSSTLDCLLPEYIDEVIGEKNSLRPKDAVGNYNMKLFIQRHSELPSLFHQLLNHPSPNHRMQLSTRLLDLLKVINADLKTFEGPYLCGAQFTLADIYIYPIVELIVVVLSTYRNFWIPPSLTSLVAWYDTVSDRPSVRAATADRMFESKNTYCYERVHRNEYLIEVYEPCARNEETLFARLTDERGRPGANAYRELDEEDAELRNRSMCEKRSSCETCVIS
mmetsp:Transcript_3346/g.7345  ORF Transcript_3346/g.7345 Transcript_3346/m.7345 type:complete len:467 (+) Transcript_3346:126-1526(+)